MRLARANTLVDERGDGPMGVLREGGGRLIDRRAWCQGLA